MTIHTTSVPLLSEEELEEMKRGGNIIYCGRANPRYGLKASPLQNIYSKKTDSQDPKILLAMYRSYLEMEYKIKLPSGRNVITRIPEFNIKTVVYHEINRIIEILEKRGTINLVCWCKSELDGKEPCHCDVIKNILEQRR